MSKYEPLRHYLALSDKERMTLTFEEIEGILGFALPKSAYNYSAWWSNGGHDHSNIWMDAGYRVEQVNFSRRQVGFVKSGAAPGPRSPSKTRLPRRAKTVITKQMPIDPEAKKIQVGGYEFQYLQDLLPDTDEHGNLVKYYPQDGYKNEKNLPLLSVGSGAFCRFSVDAGNWPGVYLWVVGDRIIYIGETVDLKRRFNTGYGYISARNCFVGGQSTNCKMNKLVLKLYEQGDMVSLYFHNTTDYKRVELDLLMQIKTPYNEKDNRI